MSNNTIFTEAPKTIAQLTLEAETFVQTAVKEATKTRQHLSGGRVSGELVNTVAGIEKKLQQLQESIKETRLQIDKERAPAQEMLNITREQIKTLTAGIEETTQKISSLSTEAAELGNKMTEKMAEPFGKILIPDATATQQGAAMLTEIAGLYNTLAFQKLALAEAQQAMQTLNVQLVYNPVENDPRMQRLFAMVKEEKEALSRATPQQAVAGIAGAQTLFTTAGKVSLAKAAAQKANTGFPKKIAHATLLDAIHIAESVLIDCLPAEVLQMLQSGGSGTKESTTALSTQIISNLKAKTNLPMLSAASQQALFKLISSFLMKSIKAGKPVNELLQ
jgi:peptidoglycan hydrolase CwlO-like protein